MKNENWKVVENGYCVVSDKKPKRPGYTKQFYESEKEYLGGYIIAESIPNKKMLNLIAAAPDLLKAAEELMADYGFQFIMASYYSDKHTANSKFIKTVNLLQSAIKKANGNV